MKKKYLIPACLLAITLIAGCGRSSQPQTPDAGADTTTTEASQSEASTESQDAATQEETSDSNGTDIVAAHESKVPVYKVITKYYNEFYDGSYKTDKDGNSLENKRLFESKYQTVMLTDSCKTTYSALYQTLKDKASTELKAAQDYAEATTKSAKEDLENSIGNDYEFFGPYYNNNTVSISRADDSILSICNYGESFMGGAHGSYGLTGETYDVRTGTELKITDVLSLTEEELNPMLKEKILATSEDEDQFWDLDDSLSHYKFSPKETDPDDYENYEYPYDWYLDHDGIHFYFGPYAIAAYAYGATDIVFNYDELKGQFNEKYLPLDEKGYITALHLPIYPIQYDDDTSDLHLVYEPYDDTDDSQSITCKSLALKQKAKSAKVAIDFDYDYTINPISSYKVVTKEGKEYIYVSVLTYSDYTEFIVFDATGGDVKLLGQNYFHMIYIDAGSDFGGELVLTDPENMYFGQVGDKLGTYTFYGRYIVGQDGLPMLADTAYTISWISQDIKSVKDINVTRIDADGTEHADETLPSGSHITPVRTNNETYMDCQLDDGSFIRLKFSNKDYPAQIDGESVDDLFEGLVYAG